jgi:hypothetical protein
VINCEIRVVIYIIFELIGSECFRRKSSEKVLGVLHKSATIRSELKKRFTIGKSEKGEELVTMSNLYHSFWPKSWNVLLIFHLEKPMKQGNHKIGLLATLLKDQIFRISYPLALFSD